MNKIKYNSIKHDIGFCEGADGWCIDEIGNQHHFKNGYMESIGPFAASVYINGTYDWRKNGLYHRVDGPADITLGTEEYYFEGKRHRMDGPAKVDKHWFDRWWINDC
jgi:hypothetical protein